MSKSWLYSLFGLGKIPRLERARLEVEGMQVLEEGLGVSVRLRRYRAPGVYAWWQASYGVGAVALTNRRFVAYVFGRKMADLPLPLVEGGRIEVGIENHSRLRLEFDAAAMFSDRSGKVTLRYRTFEADHIVATMLRPPPRTRSM